MKRSLCVAMALCLVLSLCACQPTKRTASRTGFALDTVVTITIHDSGKADPEKALDAAFAEITRLENLLSVTRPQSDVSRINASGGAPVTVSSETAQVLQTALQYAELSQGALDVTVYTASVLWDFESGVLPSDEALATATAQVNYRQLHVEGTTVTLSGGMLDLGGIAKGYVADRVSDVLKQHGVASAVVDLGGNIVALGSKGNAPFRIGVKKPADPDQLCAVIEGKNLSVVTSGIYERGFDKDGVRYHHILDPKTGMPVQNTLASVTVVCAESMDADALSTACFVLGEQQALTLIESLPNTEVLFVRRDGSVSASEGLSYTLV